MAMEDPIGSFCKSLAAFCNHLQSSCDALKQSVDRRPLPLDSASTTFVQCLNRRLSLTSSDLNLLESMSFGTVSFEELLGHCNEVFKKNQSDIFQLEDRLKDSFGYIPEIEIETDEEEVEEKSNSLCLNSMRIEEDTSFEDSLSLQNLGLSDVCLATIASEENTKLQMKNQLPATADVSGATEGKLDDDLRPSEDNTSLINLSKDDYESLPSYMKSLASWESLLQDLLAAVDKMNSNLGKQDKTNGYNYFHQDEITSLGLGPKARSYLLLLLRMNRLVVETVDGLISYRVL